MTAFLRQKKPGSTRRVCPVQVVQVRPGRSLVLIVLLRERIRVQSSVLMVG